MKQTIVAFLLLVSTSFAQWVPVAVNTNTWACKPYGATFTNYWNQLASTGYVASAVADAVTPDATTSNAPAPYLNAVFWYTFDTDSGTNYTDQSGSGNDAYGACDSGNEWNNPVLNDYAIEFDDSRLDYVRGADSDILDNAVQSTISFWVKYDSYDVSSELRYLSSAGPESDYLNYAASESNLIWSVETDSFGSYDHATNATPATDMIGEWVHFAMLHQGTGDTTGYARWYTNGVLAAEISGDCRMWSGAFQWQWGWMDDFGSPTGNDANLDDIAAWSRILSTNEIQKIVENGRSTGTTWYTNTWD